jgi:hypothetical protein
MLPQSLAKLRVLNVEGMSGNNSFGTCRYHSVIMLDKEKRIAMSKDQISYEIEKTLADTCSLLCEALKKTSYQGRHNKFSGRTERMEGEPTGCPIKMTNGSNIKM